MWHTCLREVAQFEIRHYVKGPLEKNGAALKSDPLHGITHRPWREQNLAPPPHGLSFPDILLSRNNLAHDYRALGRHQEALEFDEVTLDICEGVLGAERVERGSFYP